jgi:hypothetical protein
MNILRQFMVWVTASNKNPDRNFQSLRWRLLVAYLTAMAVIFGTSEIILYVFFSRSLEQQLNERLLTLAQAAIPSLEEVKNHGVKNLDCHYCRLYRKSSTKNFRVKRLYPSQSIDCSNANYFESIAFRFGIRRHHCFNFDGN